MEGMKPGWRRVKFGDVVRLSKARSQDPLADGIERYVGLEHLEPGDLRIRSWGNVADGVTFTSVFKPGQVLFGKRRAYQRKVAVADFAGVCSGDIFVLETKGVQTLLPELLPFICQTDAFFDHAVGTSAGSLSPRTNWKSLENFAINLPPVYFQTKLVQLLSLATNLISSHVDLTENARMLHRSFVDSFLAHGANQLLFTKATPNLRAGWRYMKIEDLCSEIVDCLHRTPIYSIEGYPAIRTADLDPGVIRVTSAQKVSFEEYLLQTSRIKPISGDVLFSREGERMGMAALVPDGVELCISQRMMHLRAKREIPANLVMEYLNSSWVQRQILSFTTGSTAPHVNVRDVKEFRVPVPPDTDLVSFASKCAEALAGYVEAKLRLESLILHTASLRETLMKPIVESGT